MHGNLIVPIIRRRLRIPNTEADWMAEIRTESKWHDDHWRLRVERGSANSVRETRAYRITVHYPSRAAQC